MRRKMMGIVIAACLLSACLGMTGCDTAGTSGSDSTASSCTYNEEYNEDSMVTVSGAEADLSAYDVYSEAGFAYVYPEEWNSLNTEENLNAGIVNDYGWLAYYIPSDKMDAIAALTDEATDDEKNEVYTEAQEAEIPICAICRVNKSDDVTRQFKAAFEDDYPVKEKLCTIGKDTYYFMYNDTFDNEALTEEDAEDVQVLLDTIAEFRENLVIFAP